MAEAAAAAPAAAPAAAAAAADDFDAEAQWSDTQRGWAEEQRRLRKQLVTEDQLGFRWPPADAAQASSAAAPSPAASAAACSSEASASSVPLRRVGGVDISFVGDSSRLACAALVVLAFPPLSAAEGHQLHMQVLYQDYEMVELTDEYVPGFLAFREVPHLLKLLDRLRSHAPDLFPQLLLVDGNGLLHPRGFGLACHLGVLADVPSIGIGKNLHMVDGLERDSVHARAQAELKRGGESFPLVGASGTTWGACLRSTDASSNPIFVSVGHRVCLDSAVALAYACAQHRVPTPVRMADLGSREYIRQWKQQQAQQQQL